jgi:hypothetical protein
MSPPNLLVNNKVSTLAAPQTATPPVTQSALAGDDKPVIEEKKTEPAADKLTTDTGANKVEPATKAKTRWRPGDLLRQLFAPKPKPASDQQSTAPSTDPTPPADTHGATGNAESGAAA